MNAIAQRQAQADAALAISEAQSDLIDRLEAESEALHCALVGYAYDSLRDTNRGLLALAALIQGDRARRQRKDCLRHDRSFLRRPPLGGGRMHVAHHRCH